MPKLDLADFAIHYELCGSGQPVLFIPGVLGTGQSDFHEQIPWFGKSFRVIAPNPRGYGQSRPPKRDYPFGFYERDAADLLALMTSLGHETFSIMGWSDGANVGALLAAEHPERIVRLVVWGGNSFLTRQELDLFESMLSISSWSPKAAEAMRAIYGDTLESTWESYVQGLGQIYAAGGEIYRAQLHLVRCPTLILHGEKDPLVPSLHPQIINDGIQGSKLYTFPEGKHNIHVKYAAEFNRLVSSFLGGD